MGNSLDSVNEAFHHAYDRTRDDKKSVIPVLILLAEKLILRVGKERHERAVLPPSYLALRSAAHAPVGMYAAVLEGKSVDRFRKPVRRALEDLDLPDPELARPVRFLLERAERFLEHAPDRHVADAFARDCGPTLLELTRLATRLELEMLRESTDALLARVEPSALEGLHVVVAGAHQARDRSIGMQYFRKRLKEPADREDRVAYAENVSDEEAALALVGIRRLDGDLARAFFGDSRRLQRDVLGDAAAELLQHFE